MKMHKITISLLVSLFILVVSFSCSKKVTSKPKFIFKAAPNLDAAFKLNGTVVNHSELVKGIEAEIFDAETKLYDLKMNKLKALVLERLMNADPRKKGLSNDQFLNKYVSKFHI